MKPLEMTLENLQSFDSTKDYLKFRKALFSSNKAVWCLPCGSFFEMPLMYFLKNPTDFDVMYCDMTLCAINDDDQVPENCTKDVLTIDPKDCHPGFVRLRNGAEYFRKPFDHYKGPADMNKTNVQGTFAMSFLEKISTRWRDISMLSSDKVYAVSCPLWPTVAHEWITRKRVNGWPPEQTINAIIKVGCHLVAKPHGKNVNDDTQWRYSFSQAEIILIHNCWTDVQKYIYHLLRIIKRDVVTKCGGKNKTFVTNYYFKTLMLWACEEKSLEFWEDRNIVTSVRELLLHLTEKLMERRIQHYFIPVINIMDDMPCNTGVENEICLLLKYGEVDILELTRTEPKIYQMSSGFFIFPNDILHPLITKHANVDWINNMCGQFLEFTGSFKSNRGSSHFHPELAYLHEGILMHLQLLKLNKYGTGNHRREVITTAEELFDMSIKKLDYGFTRIRYNLCWSIFDFAQILLILCRNEHLSNEHPMLHSGPLAPMTLSTAGYVRNTDFRNHSSSVLPKGMETNFFPIIQILFNAPTPPVNATYLICAAFKANFFCNALFDHRKALDICNEVVQLRKASGWLVDSLFADFLPFPLRNEWSCLYDKYIQIVLGFLTLHSALRVSERERSRMIPVHISSVLYLKYIYTQCRRILNEPVSPEDFGLDYHPSRKYKFDISKYTLSFSKAILKIALYISEPKLRRLRIIRL